MYITDDDITYLEAYQTAPILTSFTQITPLKRNTLYTSESKSKGYDKKKFEEMDDIIYYFKEIIRFENEIELIRKELILRSDFGIKNVFNFFDDNQTGQIIMPEIEKGFIKMNLSFKTDDLYLFVKRFSSDFNEKLRYNF